MNSWGIIYETRFLSLRLWFFYNLTNISHHALSLLVPYSLLCSSQTIIESSEPIMFTVKKALGNTRENFQRLFSERKSNFPLKWSTLTREKAFLLLCELLIHPHFFLFFKIWTSKSEKKIDLSSVDMFIWRL